MGDAVGALFRAFSAHHKRRFPVRAELPMATTEKKEDSYEQE